MRRWAAVLLLLLAVAYLRAYSADPCAEGPGDDCAPLCHILCVDGCATAPVPEAPMAPPPDPLPQPSYEAERAEHLVSLVIEPEKDPPRV